MKSPHVWQFYLSPSEAWAAMYRDCEKATKSIELEQYILENDAIGRQFVELFIKKAASGVSVFVICDRYGSASFYKSPLIKKLQHSGGRFYFYNIIHYWDIIRPWRWFPRTHIKTLLLDSRIAYTGGVCFDARMKDWRDTHIKITGPVTTQVKEAFRRAELVIKRKRKGRLLQAEDTQEEFVYLQSHPLLSWNIIYAELVKAIGDARQFMYLTTPYFAPNSRFRRLLRDASAKGIKVVILVPEHSNKSVADWLFLSYADKLLEAGVHIFLYQKSMLHSKTVIIDDEWATVGSTNMDVLSFFRNRESNLVIRNADAVADLKGQFMIDLQDSYELTKELLAKEPYWKIVIGYLAQSFKTFF
jgi:cardiolipin synthase